MVDLSMAAEAFEWLNADPIELDARQTMPGALLN